jgi:hypothetical protein
MLALTMSPDVLSEWCSNTSMRAQGPDHGPIPNQVHPRIEQPGMMGEWHG